MKALTTRLADLANRVVNDHRVGARGFEPPTSRSRIVYLDSNFRPNHYLMAQFLHQVHCKARVTALVLATNIHSGLLKKDLIEGWLLG
jgi:hypothetical protein